MGDQSEDDTVSSGKDDDGAKKHSKRSRKKKDASLAPAQRRKTGDEQIHLDFADTDETIAKVCKTQVAVQLRFLKKIFTL